MMREIERAAELDPEDWIARKRAELAAQREARTLWFRRLVERNSFLPINVGIKLEFSAIPTDVLGGKTLPDLATVPFRALREFHAFYSSGLTLARTPVFILGPDNALTTLDARREFDGSPGVVYADTGHAAQADEIYQHKWIDPHPRLLRADVGAPVGVPYSVRQHGLVAPLLRGGPAMSYGFARSHYTGMRCATSSVGNTPLNLYQTLLVDLMRRPEGLSVPCFDIRGSSGVPKPIKLVLREFNPLKRALQP